MPSSTLRKFRLCPASSAGALLSVLAVLVALAAATTTSSNPTLDPLGTTDFNVDDLKCEFVPKWLIRIAGYNPSSKFDYHGNGVRLNSEYLLAHEDTIKYADEYFPFNSTNVTKLPDALFNFYPSILHDLPIRGEKSGYARGYYPELVMKLERKFGLYRIKTRSFLESEFGPVADRFPLEKTDMPKLPQPGFKPYTNDCYVLTWNWKYSTRLGDPLIRVPVNMKWCHDNLCKFIWEGSAHQCGAEYFYNIGAPVLCSNGKEDFVTHMLMRIIPRYYGFTNCTAWIYTFELDQFLQDILNKTGYKRPDQSFCPVC